MNNDEITIRESIHLTRREKILLTSFSIIILLVTLLIARGLVTNKPTAKRKKPPKSAPAVTAMLMKARDYDVNIPVMGTVEPELQITLVSEVNGEIKWVNPEFIEGGVVAKDDVLLEIDPVDYEAAVAQAEASFEQATVDLRQEQGRQIIAEKEWKLMGVKDATELEKELALRKPQLKKAEASLKSARAALRKARADLATTRVKAPFNAVIRSVNVDIGDQASTQKTLAVLVGTDTYRIKATLPIQKIPWLEFATENHPDRGRVSIQSTNGSEREGQLIKLLSDVEPGGRMAQLLINITDPLGLNNPLDASIPLLIGEYVRGDITGKEEKNVYVVPRMALHPNDIVWLITEQNQLHMTEVQVVWRDTEKVLVRGLNNGDRLIVSDLSAPVEKMALTLNRMTDGLGGLNPDLNSIDSDSEGR